MSLRSHWRRSAAVLLAAFAALALALSVAGTASAAVRGGGGLEPEHFTIKIVNDWSRVEADGPVHGAGTLQNTDNPALDILVFDRGTVKVWHDPTPDPTIDFKSCTASLRQFGDWKFKGGTGKYRHAFGFGHFTLKLFAVFKHKHHQHGCDTRHDPVFVKVFVKAWGLAALGKHGHDLSA